jgi:hypothetical protein
MLAASTLSISEVCKAVKLTDRQGTDLDQTCTDPKNPSLNVVFYNSKI